MIVPQTTNCFGFGSSCSSHIPVTVDFLSMSGSASNGVVLATGGYDHAIRFWHAHSGVCCRTVQHPDSQVNALALSSSKDLLAAAGYQHIRLYEVNSPNSQHDHSYEGVTKNVVAVGFQVESRWLYSGGEDGTARIWDLRSNTSSAQKLHQIGCPLSAACLHPNQTNLLLSDQNGAIYVWDLRADKTVRIHWERGINVTSLDVDPDGVYLAWVTSKGVLHVYSISGLKSDQTEFRATPTHTSSVSAHTSYGLKVRFSPDSTLLVTASADKTARIWKTADLNMVAEFKDDRQRWVWDASFSLDSEYVITASSDGAARLWSARDQTVKREYAGHQKAVTAMAFADAAI